MLVVGLEPQVGLLIARISIRAISMREADGEFGSTTIAYGAAAPAVGGGAAAASGLIMRRCGSSSPQQNGSDEKRSTSAGSVMS